MTKKKAKTETVDLHQRFELGDVSRETARNYAEHLKHMVNVPGWLLLKQILEGNCARIERVIITRMDPETGAKLSETELDEYRIQLNQIERLIKQPYKLIEQYSPKEGKITKTFDPYAQSTDSRELRSSEVVRTLSDE